MRLALLLAAALAGACAQTTWRGIELELSAGAHARVDAVVRWELPRQIAGWGGYRMVRVLGAEETEIPVQLAQDGHSLVWVARGELQAGSKRTYLLRRGAAERDVVAAVPSDSGVVLRADERELCIYRDRAVAPPDGVEAKYARSGYLHPLRSPLGRVVTGDFPASHRHQHGVFLAWTRTRFEGRAVDFWNAGADTARVACARIVGSGGGAVMSWVTAIQEHVDLTAPEGPRVALEETWEIEAFPLANATVLDLRSTLTCESALQVESYHYGGMAVRGPEAWEGDAVRVMTSGGHDRVAADGARVDWCCMSGPVEQGWAGVAMMGDPHNLRAPQPVRMHPGNPYFCFAPCRLGAFMITEDEPLVLRYRIVAFDGELDRSLLERLWLDFTEPPAVRVVDPQRADAAITRTGS